MHTNLKTDPTISKTIWKTRTLIQLGVLIATLAMGIQFAIYVRQAAGEGAITVPRPESVEGFLPIGALISWKLFFFTGVWDPVHPAAMVILGFAVMISFLFRKAFCSWFCPVGTLSEWLWKAGRKVLGQNYRIPAFFDYPLRSIKYLLLGFFLFITLQMSPADIAGFLSTPYYQLADVKMLHFFTRISLATALFFAFLIPASFLVRNAWCRYLCPYGALMGLFAFFSPTRIGRNPEACINCGRCDQACHFHLPISRQLRILSPECSGCMECIRACPSKAALLMKTFKKKKAWGPMELGAMVIIVFITLVYGATITGKWKSNVTEGEFRARLQMIDSPLFVHPSTRLSEK